MTDLPARFESLLLEQGLLAPGDSAVVAVSGGLDSMVLLHLLHPLAQQHHWSLAVAHFNHQLRGRSSDADEALVRKTARALHLTFKVGRRAVRPFAKRHKLSIEMAARDLRHSFLAMAALARGSRKVLLAQHADDQLELFFLRLLRGAGPEGLRGMRSLAPSPADPEVQLIRPLLPFTRAELAAFAAERHVPFREDKSNAQLHYARNRIRHELLPLLRSHFQPALDKTIGRLMEILSVESDFVEELAAASTSEPFATLHPALQRRRLRDQCHQLGITPDFELIEHLRLLPGAEWMVQPGRVLARDPAGTIRFRSTEAAPCQSAQEWISLEPATGSVHFDRVKFFWRIQSFGSEIATQQANQQGPAPPPTQSHGPHWAPSPIKTSGLERFAADKIGPLIRLRHWHPGDRFQPIGMAQPVKLQDLFVNQKIPRAARQHLVLAETGSGEIFWIEGLRISERFKLEPGTLRQLEWRWSREPDPSAVAG